MRLVIEHGLQFATVDESFGWALRFNEGKWGQFQAVFGPTWRCPGCGQPMRPLGARPVPGVYEHARGCPEATAEAEARRDARRDRDLEAAAASEADRRYNPIGDRRRRRDKSGPYYIDGKYYGPG